MRLPSLRGKKRLVIAIISLNRLPGNSAAIPSVFVPVGAKPHSFSLKATPHNSGPMWACLFRHLLHAKSSTDRRYTFTFCICTGRQNVLVIVRPHLCGIALDLIQSAVPWNFDISALHHFFMHESCLIESAPDPRSRWRMRRKNPDVTWRRLWLSPLHSRPVPALFISGS